MNGFQVKNDPRVLDIVVSKIEFQRQGTIPDRPSCPARFGYYPERGRLRRFTLCIGSTDRLAFIFERGGRRQVLLAHQRWYIA